MDTRTTTITLDDLQSAVNLCCTCGGDGPGDCCPACEVWHRVVAAVREEEAQAR